jgi:hypothetical protein
MGIRVKESLRENRLEGKIECIAAIYVGAALAAIQVLIRDPDRG